MSPARRSQEAGLGCLCPPSGLPGTPHQRLQYLPQDTRAPSCLPGWRGKNLVCSCHQVQEGCVGVVLVGLQREGTPALLPAWHPCQEHVLPLKAGPVWLHSASAKAVQLHSWSLYPFKSECSLEHILPACNTQLLLLIFYFFCLQLQITFKVHSAIS